MNREVWLDFLRVSACFMVMMVHSTEPFYLGGDGTLVLTATDAFWVSLVEALCRCCVPLFVIASSYLQFPLHYSTEEFFRRRAVRILVPMLIWTLVYALVWGEPVANLKGLLFNFNYAAGHLWFVYMLVGLYLIMPVLSPWAEKVSRLELQVYLGIWLLTTLIPFVREAAGGEAPLIQAFDGLPAAALFPLWGEASWNPFGLFYYVSGFVGYLLVGLYIRKFLVRNKWTRLAGWTLLLMGFVAIFFGLLRRMSASSDGFPIAGALEMAIGWETVLSFCGFPVVLTAVGFTLVYSSPKGKGDTFSSAKKKVDALEKVSPFAEKQVDAPGDVPPFAEKQIDALGNASPLAEQSAFYRGVVLPLSRAGYGMYLMHMLVLGTVSVWLRGWLGVGADGVLGVWTTPVTILGTALATFVATGLISILVQRIPRVGKYLIG